MKMEQARAADVSSVDSFLDLMRASKAGEQEAAKAFAYCVKQREHIPSKLQAAIAITKIFNLFTEKVHHSFSDDLIAALTQAKDKARGTNETE
jgi:hypothetical protein